MAVRLADGCLPDCFLFLGGRFGWGPSSSSFALAFEGLCSAIHPSRSNLRQSPSRCRTRQRGQVVAASARRTLTCLLLGGRGGWLRSVVSATGVVLAPEAAGVAALTPIIVPVLTNASHIFDNSPSSILTNLLGLSQRSSLTRS